MKKKTTFKFMISVNMGNKVLAVEIGEVDSKAEAEVTFERIKGEDFSHLIGYNPPVTSVFGFDRADVITRAEEDGYSLTETDAEEVLSMMMNKGDVSIGISWDTVSYFIGEYCELNNIKQEIDI